MMVKRIAHPFACALALCLAGCAVAGKSLAVRVESSPPLAGRLSGPVSLVLSETGLAAVFSDRETTSLALSRVPDGPLGAGLTAPLLLDKVDAAPPLSPTFGEHAAAAAGGVFGVLYIDREREDKSVLKLAIGTPGAAEWRMDILEPFGRPVALLPAPGGRFGSLWAGQAELLYRPSSGPDQVLRTDFRLEGRACVFGDGRSISLFDRVSSKLLWFRAEETGLASGEIEGPGPVHATTVRDGRPGPTGGDSAGLLAVASYDPQARRIFLFEQQPSGSFARTTVTICDGTTALFCAPRGRQYVFLYDEVRPMGGGRTLSELSLLAPDGTRYGRKLISSSDERLSGFAAVLRGDTLTVAVLRDTLTILRVTLDPAPAAR